MCPGGPPALSAMTARQAPIRVKDLRTAVPAVQGPIPIVTERITARNVRRGTTPTSLKTRNAPRVNAVNGRQLRVWMAVSLASRDTTRRMRGPLSAPIVRLANINITAVNANVSAVQSTLTQ
jgi:hypothetical protein